jgi:hypothetical protein
MGPVNRAAWLLPGLLIRGVGEQKWSSQGATLPVGHKEAAVQVSQQLISQAICLLGRCSDTGPAIELVVPGAICLVVATEGIESPC